MAQVVTPSMPDYQCPNCDGGFPEPKPTDDDPECPWCGEPLNGDSETSESPQSILNPPSGSISPSNFELDDISSGTGNSATKRCPDCGDPMPMTTWVGPEPVCPKCRDTEGIGDGPIQSGDTE